MMICLYKMYDMHGYTKVNHYNGHSMIVNNVNYGSYCPHVRKCTRAIPSPLSTTKTILSLAILVHVNKQTSQSTCTYLHLGKHLIIFMMICLYKMYDMHGYTKVNHYNGHSMIVNNVNYGSYCPHVRKCTRAIPSPLSTTKTICTSITG